MEPNTSGNASVADLLVVSPSQEHFMVDVKGQPTRNFWLIQRRDPMEDLYYVLVYLPKDSHAPRYFVSSCLETTKERNAYEEYIRARGGKYNNDAMGGMNFAAAFRYEDRWDALLR